MMYPGLFKTRYDELPGRDWLRVVSTEDRAAFVAIGQEAAQHGHLGGVKRATIAQRDERGRFCSADGTNKRSGEPANSGTANDERLWWD